MSYAEYRVGLPVVVCDCCAAFGAIGDRAWREQRRDAAGRPLHLCAECRRAAVWCETHQRYHLPVDLHRRPCVTCGGLFTARVEQRLEHCPSCRRARGPQAEPPTLPALRPTTLRQLVSQLPWLPRRPR